MPVKRSGGGGGKMKSLTAAMRREMSAAVEEIAESVQIDAQVSLTTGAVTGKNHKPSAPGTPPNNNWGDLSRGVVIEKVGPTTARIVSTAPYGAIQELGGSTGTTVLPERPYMRPAGKKNLETGKAKMRAAIAHVLSGGKLRG